ncbi:MAG: hypothetical protein FWH01_02385 [Oscillospiraceae bacterium]|nr:hypothetical protein [Oscillospiraceae bacterium]
MNSKRMIKTPQVVMILTSLAIVLALALGAGPAGLPGLGAASVAASSGTIRAGEVDCAYICSELGLLLGEGQGVTDEYLAQSTRRYQAAYLTLRLVGKEAEAEAYTGTGNFNDVGHLYAGGQRRTAYLRAHSAQYGWEGDGSNNLMPDTMVTAQQFYKVLLTVLGYQANVDYPYEDTLAFADRTTGMRECRNISGGLINDEIAIMMVEALVTLMRGQTYTLAEFLAEEGVIDLNKARELGVIGSANVIDVGPSPTPTPAPTPTPPALPSTLVADSISATNFAEIDIVFNQAINKDSIDLNYFKINGGPLLATDYVYVPEGSNNATLRIYRENGFVTQQGQRVKVSVSKVRSANNSLEMTGVDDREISIYDNQTPSLTSVEAIGLRRVRLVFSEPIRTADNAVRNYATYKFNNRVMPASDAIVCNGREVYLNFSAPLEVGRNTLTIDTNRIYDLAGFPIFDVIDREFNAAEDRDAPQVVSVDAWREKVVVEFSKEVRDQVRLYWQDGSTRRSAQNGTKDPYARNIMTFTFAEGQYLPISSTEIVIEGIVDMNGNTASDYRASVTPKFDTDRPTVVSVESPGANEIIVGFSKPVRLGTANNNRFTLRNSNNVTVTVSVQAYTPSGASAPDQRYIKLTGSIPAGTYTLTVVNVEDTTAQINRSVEESRTVVVADKAPPSVVSVTADRDYFRVALKFDKQIDWGSAYDIANYQYFDPVRGHVEVPNGTGVILENDNMTVVITFPSGGWVIGSGNQVDPDAFRKYVSTDGANELRIMNIKDLNGNAMEPTLIDVPGPTTNVAAAKLLPAVYAVSSQRLMMRFEAAGALPTNAASQDFIVRAGNQNLNFRSMSSSSINSSSRELYIDFDTFDLNTDGTYGTSRTPVTVAMVPPNQVSYTKTALGVALEIQGGVTLTVTDNIKPGLHESYRGNRSAGSAPNLANVSFPALTRDQVLVVFDELIQFQGYTGSQLIYILDVRLESQPNTSISPSLYTVTAYDNQLNDTSASNTVNTRMIVVTFVNPINEAVNVSVRANTLWDGNRDAYNSNIMNEAFETGFLWGY